MGKHRYVLYKGGKIRLRKKIIKQDGVIPHPVLFFIPSPAHIASAVRFLLRALWQQFSANMDPAEARVR